MSRVDDVTCRALVELLTDYLEGSITPELRVRIDAHLATCGGCANALEQLRDTIRVTGTIAEDRLPPEQSEAMRAVFRAWERA
jgi:predicted anti-sigma-YlaC factor YlaD